MSKVKGAGGPLLEGITRSGDVVQMQCGTFADHILDGIFVEVS